jgi:hypothetical protein
MTGWLRRLFAGKPDGQLDRLARRLIFYQDEATVLDALREATSLAPKGDDLGVRALSEAIRRRCGRTDVTFYAPAAGLTMRSMEETLGAEERLLDLARSGRLLADPAATQNLISAALGVSKDGLQGLVRTIFAVAGAEGGYDFQLLFNQMRCSLVLRRARGEQSWTESMQRNGPPQFG